VPLPLSPWGYSRGNELNLSELSEREKLTRREVNPGLYLREEITWFIPQGRDNPGIPTLGERLTLGYPP